MNRPGLRVLPVRRGGLRLFRAWWNGWPIGLPVRCPNEARERARRVVDSFSLKP